MPPKRTPVKNTPAKGKKSDEDNDSDVDALIHLRGVAHAKVLRIKNALIDADQTELNPPQVKMFIKKLENAYSEFSDVHQRIIEQVSPDKREEHDDQYLQFETLHDEVSLFLETSLENFPAQSQPNAQTPAANVSQPFVIQQQLPRVLPTFDGNYEQWEKFKAMFRDVVDKSTEPPRIKLYHLEKALIGRAAGLIDAKTISDGNYEYAWKLLEERYEDKRRLIDLHIGGLLGIKRCTKESYNGLRDLVEKIVGHVENLKFLGQEFTGVSEQIVIYLIAQALDDETKKLWESSVKKGELPSYDITIAFLKDRVSVLERCEPSREKLNLRVPARATTCKFPVQKAATATASPTSDQMCDFCSNNHPSFKCEVFNKLSVGQRLERVREKKVCFNCLRRGHRVNECRSKKSCSKCQRKHHTLLHYDVVPSNDNESAEMTSTTSVTPSAVPGSNASSIQGMENHESTITAAHSHRSTNPSSQVVLLTALVNVLDANQQPHPCRALLDCGSQVNFLSQSMANALNLNLEEVCVPISGIGSVRSTIKQRGIVQVNSRCENFSFALNCLISPTITGLVPSSPVDFDKWNIPSGIKLADPMFDKPDKIDLLIGMEMFYDLMLPGYVKLSDDLPMLHNSQLGWLIGGNYNRDLHSEAVLRSHTVNVESIGELMQKFWEVESVSTQSVITTESEECEKHFLATYRRNPDGRFVVQLPLKENVCQLQDSKPLALRRFFILESKLIRQPELRLQYCSFMDEYEALGHCKEVKESDDPPNLIKWYLAHHAVLRPSSTSTKCRVVFDASAKVNGCSLNDMLMVGPTVQRDLLQIILCFRKFNFVMSADIAKMYRQILIDTCHSPLQRIFWRKSPKEPIRTLELTTVTYGTASAPYLATRALLQLARDGKERYPLAARVIEENFYVDNALFGFDSFEETFEAREQLIALIASGGMHLHKWSSNDDRLLCSIPEEDRDSLVIIGNCEANKIIKALGLMWNPLSDEFLFVCQPPTDCEKPTKRQVLSTIAKIFDPLGLISPVVVLAKILMQRLWISKLKWDDVVEGDLYNQWRKFLISLPITNHIRIPRQVLSREATSYELHGFSDASQVAYGACIYFRSSHSDGTASMKLVISKSKIAPIDPVTIPRLELSAALLLNRLTNKILTAIGMHFSSINLWCDSQVVLAWLTKPAQSLPIYVRNRTAEIVANENFKWRYVKTSDNPADMVSRGQSAADLKQNDMWWNGPRFLRETDYHVDNPDPLLDSEIPEMKTFVAVHVLMNYAEFPILTKFESFRKTQRIVAYVLRFISNTRKKKEDRVSCAYPTLAELRESLKRIVGALQQDKLSKEIECVTHNDPGHSLNNLNPFLDNDGILRVGGRTRHSVHLSFDTKHQWILPCSSPVTHSLITAIHRENLHVGLSGVIAILRQQFWIPKIRSTVRQVLRKCVVCFRMKPETLDQQMGDLPAYRVNISAVFQRVGVDFAGPIMIKQAARRTVPIKGYICVFVCMVTKAIHLEAVENLTTEAFLAALQRFVSRRGIPETIFSDNGTNFIGAKSELHELFLMFQQEGTTRNIFEYCQAKEIEWRTIPPNAPHFGGIWEAGVKSVKSVLKRVYKSVSLTIFEFSTLLCQIEAILNSRPLYTSSSDPHDSEPLTPGHFIVNRPLTAVPEPTYLEIPTNRLSRWQHIKQLRDHFWRRWSREYLTDLQVRSKWLSQRANVRPGMIVLVREDNLPPQNWRLGRIERVYPGSDGLIRVVDVKSNNGILKRPIQKLAPLPILENLPSSEI